MDIELVSQLKDYIESHLAEPITLDELAAKGIEYKILFQRCIHSFACCRTAEITHKSLSEKIDIFVDFLGGAYPMVEIAAVLSRMIPYDEGSISCIFYEDRSNYFG